MKRTLLFSCGCLAFAAATANAYADDQPWAHVGDLHLPVKRVVGKLDLNLGNLRVRTRHYEVWERIAFEPAVAGDPVAEDDLAERLTLWAIRCGSGEMAKVVERAAGSFSPRAEKLRFYTPAPNSSGAAVIETTCAEVRRRAADGKSSQEGRPGRATAATALDLPPGLSDEYADDSED